MVQRLLLFFFASLALLSLGCANSVYRFGTDRSVYLNADALRDESLDELAGNPVFWGDEYPVVDKIERLVQSPRRWFRNVRQKTELTASETMRDLEISVANSQAYLQANGLNSVSIDVRRYEPVEQWARLKSNDQIAPIWKYTGGTLNHIRYTFLPLKAFHRDAYDPFTNTLHLNSGRPAVAVFHAAEAKQYWEQRFPGVYAVALRLPSLPIAHSIASASDAISYARATEQNELELALYPVTYSRLASVTVAEIAALGILGEVSFFEIPLLRLVSRTVGKMAGDAVSKQRSHSQSSRHVEAARFDN